MVHYTSQMANNLAESVDTSLIAPEDCDHDYFDEKIDLRTVKTPPRGKWFNKDQLDIFKLFNLIREIDPDIIHISGNYIWIIGLFFFFKIKKYPVVVTLHDVNVHEGEDNFINRITNYIYLKMADHLIVHGIKLKEELLQNGIDEDIISVINHGDYSFFTKHCKDDVEEDGSILFFGRIHDYKGLIYLFKALEYIKKDIPHVNVIIAGRGNLEKYDHLIKDNSNLEIINRYIEDELVAELFQRASVVVMPYTEGSQSGIIPIAYSFKKPVVVTDVGSIPEVVEDGVTGFIVPPKDPEALANATLAILKNNQLRKEMGSNAHKKMKDELSWDDISKRLTTIYQKVIDDTNESN